MRRAIDRGKLAGVLALVAGVLVLGTALAQALRRETTPLPEAQPAADLAGQVVTPRVPAASPPPAAGAISDEIVREAVSRAPFDPDRRPPTKRYRLPGESQQQVFEAMPLAEAPPEPPLRVLGTIAYPGGGIAVIQAERGEPRVVTVGEMIGEYRLASVREESVTVSLREWELDLALEVNRTVEQESRSRSGRTNSRETTAQERQRMLETLVRSMQERLGSGYRVQMQGSRAFLIGPDGSRREIQVPGGGTSRIAPTVRYNTTIPPDRPEEQSDLTGTSRGGY